MISLEITVDTSNFKDRQVHFRNSAELQLKRNHVDTVKHCTLYIYIPNIFSVTASTSSFLLGGQKIGGVWQWKNDGSKTVFSDSDLVSSGNGDCVVLQTGSSLLNTTNCNTNAKYACMKGIKYMMSIYFIISLLHIVCRELENVLTSTKCYFIDRHVIWML